MTKKAIKIEIDEWTHDCADGCCTRFGTTTKVNGEELSGQDDNAEFIIKEIFTHLGIDAEVIKTYNGESYD